MASVTPLNKAGQDVLRYHSRRVYVPRNRSTDNRIFYASWAVGAVGLCLSKMAPTLGMILEFTFPVCYVLLLLKMAFTEGFRPTRSDAEVASRKYGQAINLLIHSADRAVVGPLCEILWLPDITGYVPLALRNILPQLQPQDATLLNRKQRDCLMRILTQPEPNSLDLQRVTVKALANIGDADALPVLEQLADGAWGAAESPELREEARAAFCELQERINPGFAGRNLLRASDAPVMSSNELLRPATSQSETPPQELLRAHNSP